MTDRVPQLDFLQMERVSGPTLDTVLATGPLSLGESIHFGLDIAKALSAAHSRGLVHGGLSAHNIAITPEGAVLLHPPDGRDPASAPYRSPEQVRRNEPDTRSDVWAFGVLLFHMLTGVLPFAGEGRELDEAILHQPPISLDRLLPVRGFDRLIASCLHKDPARRRQRIRNAGLELRILKNRLALRPPSAPADGPEPVLIAETPPIPDEPETTAEQAEVQSISTPDAETLRRILLPPGVPSIPEPVKPTPWRSIIGRLRTL